MTISRSEAATALSAIDSTAGRTRIARDYRIAGPMLILGGMAWMLGYAATGVLPSTQWRLVWLGLDAAVVAGILLLAYRSMRGGENSSASASEVIWRPLAGALTAVIFLIGTYMVLQPVALNAYLAFPGLLVGFIYVLLGFFQMFRFAVVGGMIFFLTLAGFFALPDHLSFWMAVVGGGGLIVGGLWLRSP